MLLGSACSSTGSQVLPPRPEPLPTTVVNGAQCEPTQLPVLPSGTGCLTGARGDADRDAFDDTYLVFASLSDDLRPREWFVGLRTRAGLSTQRLEAGNDFTYPRVVGLADVDGDGSDELFVKAFDLAGHGTNWQSLQLFRVVGERLRVVNYENQPLALRVGGPSRTGEGVNCSDGFLGLLRAGAINRSNTRWAYSVRVFKLVGARARFVSRSEGNLTIADYNDPKLDRFYSLRCFDLLYPKV